MKKALVFILALCMILSLAACGSDSTDSTDSAANNTATVSDPDPGKAAEEAVNQAAAIKCKHLGVVVAGLTNEWMVTLANRCQNYSNRYGIECTVVSYDNEIARQVSCIENLATAGCDAIFYTAGDPKPLLDVTEKYKNEGILMISYIGVYDSDKYYTINIVGGDPKDSGEKLAELASAWVDETFPDAGEGEVGVVIIGARSYDEGTRKTEGMYHVFDINPKCALLKEYLLGAAEGDPTVQAGTFSYAAQVEFGDRINVIFCVFDGFAVGANEAFMGFDADLSKIGIFTIDCGTAICDMIMQSETDDALIRGAVAGQDAATLLFDYLTGDPELNEMNEYVTGPVIVDSPTVAAEYKEFLTSLD